MRWVVEEFTSSGENMVKIEKALKELEIPYIIVNIEKEIRVIDKETRIPRVESMQELQEFIKGTNTLVYGSKSLKGRIGALGIQPGSYATEEKLDYCRVREQIPGDMLNDKYKRGRIKELEPEPEWETFFIRPIGNSKVIDGKVITRVQYKQIQALERQYATKLSKEDLMIAPIKNISEEYRFFVVSDKVVSGSSYKVNGWYDITKEITKELLEYTQGIVDKLDICNCYVLDIAREGEVYKVMEINDLVTSGIYGVDIKEVLKEIEKIK